MEHAYDPVLQAVNWFRDTTVSKHEQLARRITAIALSILLTMTIVGIYFVVRGIKLWMQLSSTDKNTISAASPEVYPARQQNADLFPEPYQKLRQMGLYNNQELEPIRRRLKIAISSGHQTFYPRCYPQLVEAVGSEEKCKKLFDEGLILIHYLCMREYEGARVNPIDYQKFVRPYMDMLFSYLLEHRKFPNNIYDGWVLD